MKKLLLSCLLLSLSFYLFSWDWVKRAGGDQLDWPWSICADAYNNCYLTGSFQGIANFGSDNLTSNSSVSDLFISKLNANGDFAWTLQGYSNHGAVGLSIDENAGNIYVTGYFVDSLYIDGHTLTGNGVWDVFVLKCSADGHVQQAISFGSAQSEIGYGLSVNNSKVFVTGWYNGNMLVGNQTVITAGGSDIFTVQYDSNLNFENVITGNGPGVNYAYEIDSDDNKTYTVGTSGGPLNFNNTPVDSTGGSYLYIKDIISNEDSYYLVPNTGVMNAKVDPQGNVYVVGTFSESAQFGNTIINPTNNTPDFYCAKMNTNHEWEWAKSYGSSGIDKGKDITYFNNNVYLVCNFNDTLHIDENNFVSQGNENIALIQFDSAGNVIKVSPAGGQASTIASGICVSPSGIIYVTGWFGGTSYFGDIQVNSSNDTNLDIYIAKYTINTHNDDNTINPIKPGVNIYPNPLNLKNNDLLNFDFSKSDKGNKEISLFNIKGQKISSDFINTHSNNIYSMNLKVKTSGIYFIKINDGKTSLNKKILIIK